MNSVYMNIAIKEAKKAYKKGEVPVGAVIVKNNKIIAKAHNTKEKSKQAICHAEINAIKKATKKIKNWRLTNCDIYITLFPCPMCASAIQCQQNICDNESLELLQTFFQKKRKEKNDIK